MINTQKSLTSQILHYIVNKQISKKYKCQTVIITTEKLKQGKETRGIGLLI